jgi:predicted metal-dependent hydrolase
MELPCNYILERRTVKHSRIRVSENCTVRVIVPKCFTEHEIFSLLNKKQGWINRHLHNFEYNRKRIDLLGGQLLYLGCRYRYFYSSRYKRKVIVDQKHKTIQAMPDLLEPANQKKWYRQEAEKYLKQRIVFLSKQHKIGFNRLFIRDQKTKWGNCSSNKNISLNWRLIKTPEYVIDYIILHELVHARVMDHSKQFWMALRNICPEYNRAIKWLQRYGNNI